MATNFAWLMTAELVGKLSGFVLVVILARGLGPRQYGYFAFALAFVPLFLHLARWGIDVASLRRVSVNTEDFSKVFVNGGVLRLGLAVSATVVALLLLPFFVAGGEGVQVVLVLSVALLLDEVATYQSVAFTAVEQMRFNAGVLIVNRVVSTALAGVVVAAGGGLLEVCLAYTVGSLGAVVVGGFFLLTRLPPLDVHDFSRGEVRGLLREGAPYGIAAFLNMAVFRVDSVLLELLRGPVAVGFYGVAYRFFEPLLFITWTIAQTATPQLVRDAQPEADGERRTFELALAATLVFYVPIAAGAPFAVDWLVETLFGDRYLSARAAVLWLAAAAVPYAVAHLARTAAIAGGAKGSITWIAGSVLAVNVGLNLALIPGYGVTGAAAATFVTEVIECALLLTLYGRRVARVRVGGATVAPVLAGGCMAGVLTLVGPGPAVLAIGPVVFVGALAVLLRVLAPGDTRAVLDKLRLRAAQ